MKITPDYDLLRKYLPLVQKVKYTWYFDYLLNNVSGFETNFTALINNNDLSEHSYELLYYAGGYAIRISQFFNDIKNHNALNQCEIFNKDFDTLKSFIAGKKCHAIKFIAPKNTIAIESEYLIAGLMELVEKFTEAQLEFPVPTNPIPHPPQKQSYYKNFCKQILKELFPYLKNETDFRTKSNNDTYSFIVDFTTILNLNWKNISDYPDEYLKDLHQKAKSMLK